MEHTEALHRQVHTPFLNDHPPDASQSTDPATAWCTAQLTDDVYWRSIAISQAAQAVLALATGLTVHRLTLPADRTCVEAGRVLLQGPLDAQDFAVSALGGGQAHAIWLDASGYPHAELRRCVLEMCSAGNSAVVDHYERQGMVIDRKRAVAHALRLLSAPGTFAAIEAVADRLGRKYELDGEQVTVITEQHHLACPRSQYPLRPTRTSQNH
ncbi:hypothetical protein ACH4VR_29170 [Streptomyces sp. NPDC020883]|uniref:hypothetical protein n=1 Tax=Streptomyces sp. NPDC020883 TaxID=3365099 RepID=UPI0037B5A910